MNSSHDVAVIIPNYNCLSYLPACLKSIRSQKGVSYQIIVVDDGSTDGSIEWLEREAHLFNDLIVLKEQGLGPGGARNIAAQVATATHLAFLDADDTWEENKLAKQVEFLNLHPDVVLSFTDYEHIAEDDGHEIIGCFDFWPQFSKIAGALPDQTNYHYLENACATIFSENIVGTSTTVVRRDAFLAVQGFDVNLPSASDWDLWLKLARIGAVAFTAEKGMRYLMRKGSVSSNIEKRLNAMKAIMDRHGDYAALQMSAVKRFAKARLASGYRDQSLSENRYLASVFYSLQAFSCLPSKRYFKALLKDVVLLPKQIISANS